jgi:hypothetical protein
VETVVSVLAFETLFAALTDPEADVFAGDSGRDCSPRTTFCTGVRCSAPSGGAGDYDREREYRGDD